MLFPKEFIKLQFKFARKVSDILHIPFINALFEYTSMPVRVGVPFSDMNKSNRNWVEFIKFVISEEDYEFAYKYHVKVMKDAPPMRTQFGCFSYDFLPDEKLVRIHFSNNDLPNPGVLSDERLSIRMGELKEMFKDIYSKHPEASEGTCSSWLFNIGKFKRLFPKEFFQHNSIGWDYRSLGLWGQFIDKYGNVKNELIEKFLISIDKAETFEDLQNAFPLKEIKCWSHIQYFYQRYRIV